MEILNKEDYTACVNFAEKINQFKDKVLRATHEHVEGVKDDALPIVNENAIKLENNAETSFAPCLDSFKETIEEIAAAIKEGIVRVGGEV